MTSTPLQSCKDKANEKISIEETKDLAVAEIDLDATGLNMQNMQAAF